MHGPDIKTVSQGLSSLKLTDSGKGPGTHAPHLKYFTQGTTLTCQEYRPTRKVAGQSDNKM